MSFCFLSESSIYISAVDEIKTYMSGNLNILNVMTASSYNTDSSNKTIKYIHHHFENTKKSKRGVWLYGLDISTQDRIEINMM